ncbi:histidine utilization repressor [Alteromonas sp. ASW11-130]|uniref:histidine utilization repressor n=1 Tax=Alteromonas sp. ASW11-130 TaxID=3015775 RepID=UPI00224199FA|nr:histidine utilization repressor [Alteromonas sp. ASW11-130]MCW8092185.1 histidine utilization repressor [Alteromonas sp. ASW11-130]
MIPRYLQIKSALLERIEAGDLTAGEQVASENQLANDYAVSRMTARRAVSELVEEGILARSQGIGTFVADARPMSSILTINNIQHEIEARGHQYTNKLLLHKVTEVTAQQSQWIGLEKGSPAFRTQVVHYENGNAVQLEDRFVNPLWAPGYIDQNLNELTAHEYLSRVAPLTEADHTVEAILPSAAQAALLKIDYHQPCLQIKRRTFSAKGIVSFALLTHPGNRYRLGGHLHFTTTAKEIK